MKLKHFRYVCPKLPLKGFIVEIVAVLLGFEFIPYNCVFGDFDLSFLVF